MSAAVVSAVRSGGMASLEGGGGGRDGGSAEGCAAAFGASSKGLGWCDVQRECADVRGWSSSVLQPVYMLRCGRKSAACRPES